MRLPLLSLFLIAFGLGSFARAQNSALTGETATDANARRWNLVFDANHTFQALDQNFRSREDQEAFTNFTAWVDYQLSADHTIRVLQGLLKRYEVTSDTLEWAPSDTTITHIWRLPTKFYGASLQWFNGIALPLSEQSVQDDKITHFNSQLRVNYAYGRFFFSMRPFARYSWYKFKNTQGGFGVSGRALPMFTLGVTGLAIAGLPEISERLSLIGVAGFSYVTESNSALANDALTQPAPESGTYTFAGYLNYQMTDKISAYANYSQGDRYLQDGRYELFAYDPEVTQYGVGLTVIY